MIKYKYCLICLAVILMAACSKEDFKDGTPYITPGDMIFESISADSAGNGELLTLKGKGLGDIRTVLFEKDSVYGGFYPTLNTDHSFLFRVPDTAKGGTQHIHITNSEGKTISIPFKVLAYASVTNVSNYNFVEGDELVLDGINMADVIKVELTDLDTEVEIIESEYKKLIVKMPATEANRVTLNITNETGTVTTTQEFINLDKAFKIFTDDFENGFGNGSWGEPATVTTDVFKTGTASVYKIYTANDWHLINFANWWPGVDKDPEYKYLTLWIKGGSTDQVLYLTGDKRPNGFGNGDRSTPLNVPANVWTYFKIPMEDANLWATDDNFNQLGFWIAGPENGDETFHFDDVLLVK